MASEGYFSLGGTEITNAERWSTYTRNLGIFASAGCPCPNLHMLLADPSYTTPKDDRAPWYDENVPESADFAGFWVQEWKGLSGSTITREYVRNIVAGAVPNPVFDAERVVAVTGFLTARSEVGLAYGIAWLSSVLRAGADCEECTGDEACFLSGCPEECGSQTDMDELWATYSRYIYDVGLVDGPRILEKRTVRKASNPCCDTLPGCGSCGIKTSFLAKVEFTLTAGVPWIFTAPAAIASSVAFTPPEEGEGCTINWIVLEPGQTCPIVDPCPDLNDCLSDPFCQTTSPPQPPVVTSPCSCTSRLTEATIEINSPPGLLPRNLDAVPIITVNTGDADMRRLTIRFFSDPLGFGCGEPLDACRACAEITLTYAPRDAVITLDGRTQRGTVSCPGGGESDAAPYLFGPDGGPVDWPAFSCGSGLCVQVLVDGQYYSTAARVSVSLAARMDAS